MQELWAEIDGYPNYMISNYGQVYSRRFEKMLRLRPSQKGYLRVTLTEEGRRVEVYVNHLVAKAFFSHYRDGMRIAYVNGDITDNRTENLRLQNSIVPEYETDRYMRRDPWGVQIRIVETGEIFRTVRDCARYIGGDYSDIYSCLRGERKKHLGYTFEYLEEWV